MIEKIRRLRAFAQSSNGKLLYAGAGLFLSACFLVMALTTLAWFAANSNVDGSGIRTTVDFDDTTVTYDVYKWNVDSLSAVTTDEYGAPLTLSGLRLNSYDVIFVELNQYAPVLVRVALTGTTMPRSGNVTLTFDRDTAGAAVSDRLPALYTSLIRFSGGTLSGITSASTPTAIYERGVQVLDTDSATWRMFTSKSGSIYSKIDSITLTIPYAESDWQGDTLYIYFLMDYEETLTHDFVRQNMDVNAITIGENIELPNDIAHIRIGHD